MSGQAHGQMRPIVQQQLQGCLMQGLRRFTSGSRRLNAISRFRFSDELFTAVDWVLVHTSSSLPQPGCISLCLLGELLSPESANGATSKLGASLVVIGELGLDSKILSLCYVEDLAANHGEKHFLPAELFHGHLEEVVLQNNNVGQLANLKRTNLLVGAQEAGAVDGDGAQG
ncbi:hypothetical protein NM208_g11920 [Fusarium decemcellulare]|uniref:Uncharacterized protein n=1 Tax=Fusarium decemcellulare TaxID=57161 RepID=A0ACC1RTZ9_9HYPO|nr:hypothetical protein NM208_g11920 [Fusarium decemcellulare]